MPMPCAWPCDAAVPRLTQSSNNTLPAWLHSFTDFLECKKAAKKIGQDNFLMK